MFRSFGYVKVPFVFCLCYDFKEDNPLIDGGLWGLPNFGLVSQNFVIRWGGLQIILSPDQPETGHPKKDPDALPNRHTLNRATRDRYPSGAE